MNLSRLAVLGLLAANGPRHGHQIRKDVEQTDVSSWGGVSIGSLYRELRLLEEAGMIRVVRSEQLGRRPERRIYAIEPSGLETLRALRTEAVRSLRFGPDPLGVALIFGRIGDSEELGSLLRERRAELAENATEIEQECAELVRQGALAPLDRALFLRRVMLLRAEVQWLDQFTETIVTSDDDLIDAEAQPEGTLRENSDHAKGRPA